MYVKLASYKNKTLHYFNMARRRTKRVKTAPVKQKRLEKNLFTQVNVRNLIAGVIVVTVVAFLGFGLLSKKAPLKLPVPALISPPAVSPAITPTPTPSLPVKKLPDTAGEPFSYTVKQNDSLYAIGLTFCDNKAAWIDLAEENNLDYPYILHNGETLTLSCP